MVALYDAGAPGSDFLRTSATADDGDPSRSGADIGTGPFASENGLSATAVSGTRIIEIGFTGAGNEFWTASPTTGILPATFTDIAAAAAGNPGDNFGTVNYALNKTGGLLNFSRTESSPLGGFVDVRGNANIQGTRKDGSSNAVLTPFDLYDDTNANFAPASVVPEPASMALVGIGFVVLVGVSFSRKRQLKIETQA